MIVKLPPPQAFHFDVDKYLNPFLPPSQVRRLPKPIARFLGYSETPRQEIGNLFICLWSLVGTFAGLVLVAGIFKTGGIAKYHPPTLLASFGASAVLEYNVIKSPLGQPRNSVFGHTFSAITGVIIAKLFKLSASFETLRWIAGPLSCGIATMVMTLTNTTHPPGGATALLAVIDPTVFAMGWALVPVIMLGSTLMVVVALLINNIQRQFPTYFWTDKECGQFWRERREKHSKISVDMLEAQKHQTLHRDRIDNDGDNGMYSANPGVYATSETSSGERLNDHDVTRPKKSNPFS